ncbi:MAG TPA: hypothetical protein VD913_03530 [bacterium]|nr:hypothetical protein [bacterium]
MYKDRPEQRYPWAEIKNHLDKLIYELSKAEDEEDIELSMLRLHFHHDRELSYFEGRALEEVKELLVILIRDTERHHGMLGAAVKELKELKETKEKMKDSS